MKIEHGRLILNSTFGERKEIEVHIEKIDFLHHSITLGRIQTVEVRK